MANGRQRGSGVFPGVVLLTVGTILLIHNYRGMDIFYVLSRFWPLALIFLGAIKLYERAVASRSNDARSARITGGEIVLVVCMITLLSFVAAIDYARNAVHGSFNIPIQGDVHSFDLDVAPKAVSANARISVHGAHGNITLRATDTPEIRVSGQKNVHAWNEDDAQQRAAGVSVEIVPNGDGYEVHPTSTGDSRIGVDMDIQVPLKAQVTVKNDRGDVTVSDLATPVNITNLLGDVEVRNTASDVTIEMHKGDVKVSDTKGNVKISGRGTEVNVASATGSLTLEGEFFGPIRVDKIAKGVRFISQRTDLTLTQLTGHLETGSGNLEIVDAPGDLNLRTNRYTINIENAGGKVKVDNRGGDVELRFSKPPKDDIEVNNSNADVSITLPESSNFNIAADCHSCDVNSEFSADTLNKTAAGSNDNHFEGKYGNARGPKITLKTSYDAINIRKTS